MLSPFPESSHQLPDVQKAPETRGKGWVRAGWLPRRLRNRRTRELDAASSPHEKSTPPYPSSLLELSHDPDYDQRFMTAAELKPMAFFEGLHLLPRVICGIGACLFLASFFVRGFEGFGRALGLFGMGLVMCGVAVNLLMEIFARDAGPQVPRHLIVQSILASVVAIAVFFLAVYVYRHGTLPRFMPTRYD